MSQFRERYQQYVETKAPSSPPVMNASGGKGFFNKFYVQGLIVGVVIIGSGVLVYLNFKPSTQNNVAANPTPKPIAQVTQAPKKIEITEDQIDAEMMNSWGQYYYQLKSDQKLRDIAKTNLTKKLLVQAGASKYNLDLSSIASDNPVQREQQSEDKLAKKVLSWRGIDYAYIYIDPTVSKYKDYPEQAIYSLNLIKSNLSSGNTFKEAYELAKKDSKFLKLITVYYDKVYYRNDWDKAVSDILFSHKKGENTDIISPPGGVFILAHINDANDTQYATMDEWISSQSQ